MSTATPENLGIVRITSSVTRARVAEARPEQFKSPDLSAVAAGHRREDAAN